MSQVLLAMWVISISDPSFEIWITSSTCPTHWDTPRYSTTASSKIWTSVSSSSTNSHSDSQAAVFYWFGEGYFISFGYMLHLWKLHRGWRHCSIIKRQRDDRLNIKVVPSLGSYKRHFDVRLLVLSSPYPRLPAMFPKMCTTFLMKLLGFLIFLWLNDGNMSVIQMILSMTLEVWALDFN